MKLGTNSSKVVEEYAVPKTVTSTWLLPENKVNMKSAFHSGEVSTKRQNVRVKQKQNEYFAEG